MIYLMNKSRKISKQYYMKLKKVKMHKLAYNSMLMKIALLK